MFSLGIYDTLTQGSLTDGQTIAGTGTIDAAGNVGPIGGIQQKIVGRPRRRRRALPGAAGQLRRGRRRAPTATCGWSRRPRTHSALESIKKWVEDPDAKLPDLWG